MTAGIKSQNIQIPQMQQYQCSPYAYNPYVCAYAPVSQIVMPQGQVQMPTTIVQPPEVQTIQIPPQYDPSVNYNQITPYLNTGSTVFQPGVTAKSGQLITTAANESSKPMNMQESQIVYKGPVKVINPQVTPGEQIDNEINKQMIKYFKDKADFNDELKKTLSKVTGGNRGNTPWYKTALKLLGVAAVVAIGYCFRKKIPFLDKFYNYLLN